MKEGTEVSLISLVANFHNSTNGEWNLEKLGEFFDNETIKEILKINWPKAVYKDRLIWMKEELRVFSMKSCYKALLESRYIGSNLGI